MRAVSISLKVIFLSNTINSPTQHEHIKWNISWLRSILAWSGELPWSGSYQFKKHCGIITLIRSLLILHLALKPLNNNSWNKYLWWNVNVTSKLYQKPSHPNIIVSQKPLFWTKCLKYRSYDTNQTYDRDVSMNTIFIQITQILHMFT